MENNIIKAIDIPYFSEVLMDNTEMTNNEIIQICLKIENDNEFKKIFFHRDGHTYFYESKNEEQLKECLFKHTSLVVMNLIANEYDVMYDFGKALYEYESNLGTIDLENCIGNISVKNELFYRTLNDNYLNNQMFVKRLVDAEDFRIELIKIENECLKTLLSKVYNSAMSYLESNNSEQIQKIINC